MSVILPLFVVVVKLEGKSCGRLVDKSVLHLRRVFHAHDAEIVHRDARTRQLRFEDLLAPKELRHLALDLAQLLDHQLLQHLLAQHGDRHDRTGALAGLGCVLVRSVLVRVAHAIIISSQALPSSPLKAKSKNISHFVLSLGMAWG